MKVHLLLIDPQRDFCEPSGSLFVKGANADMDRLALMIERLKGKLADIHVTLDSHQVIDISHPQWWVDSSGKHPGPFTLISAADVVDGRWTTTRPSFRARSLQYLDALEAGKRYPHVTWPEHCLVGTTGHAIYPSISESLHAWVREKYAIVDYVTKGSNPWTEHFSAVRAEVPDPQGPSTQLNTRLVRTLEEADVILLAGEARSHCLANSVRDVATAFSDTSYVSKMVLLTDACSDVTTFEAYGEAFVKDMLAAGMKTATTADFLA